MTTPFTFAVLRYTHDALTEEFVNVGVLLCAPDAGFLGVRYSSTYGRLSRTFGPINGDHFKRQLRLLAAAVASSASELQNRLPLFEVPTDASSWADRLLPPDDPALRFYGIGGGVTKNPQEALDRLFERYVERYSTREERPARNDEEVLSTFKRQLQERHVLSMLKPKVISTPDYEHEFPLAFRNGIWNACEAVSLDLIEESSILEKAQRWLGRGVTLHKSPEPFKIVFLLGEPASDRLKSTATKALNIMHQMPCKHEFFREDEATDFAAEVVAALEH